MKRSLLYQIGETDGASKGDGFRAWLTDVQLADRLGIDTVWCLPSAGEAGDFRLGTPELWLAAAARSTERIRLGWGLASMFPPQRPPIRSAEQAAGIDLLSKGRLELALVPEMGAPSAGISAESSGAKEAAEAQAEGFRMLVEMWDAPKFSWTSPRFTVPPVDVVPKPVQSPHPPLALVGWSEGHARRAGQEGLGYVDVSGANDAMLEVHRDAYRAARAEASPEDLVSTAHFAAALEWGAPGELEARLAQWQQLEIDEAILRLSSGEVDGGAGGPENHRAIRWLAEETAALH